ncbi:glycosyltransferase family 4 protein [Pseudomonas nitroreducens]|uniref:glycosyltransferase family 4 protein n=1 Tax=Pseudomonas nitroreducens TaxID=46680 RepID=UPI002D7EE808|nr:glycosyltransferase family 4 protein [Pseudomonas nitroreducens]
MNELSLRTLKILHVAETIQGGVATYLETLDKTSPHDNRYLIPGSQRKCIDIDSPKLLLFNGDRRISRATFLFQALHKALKRDHYDLIHLHSSLAGYIFVLRRLMLLKIPPTIYCAHGWSFLRETSRMEHLASRSLDLLTGMLADGIIHISRTEQERASFIPNANQAIIYNPVDPHYLTGLPWQGRKLDSTVLFVGRLDRQKGFDLLYRAFTSPSLRDVQLLVAGSAVLGGCEYVATDNIRFLGWQDKNSLSELYERATLTIMPSRWEGFGLVAIESLAKGTPVLVNQTGSLPEIVDPVGLVADLSSEETLIRHIKSALSTGATRPPEELRNFVRQRFAPDNFARELSAFYARTLRLTA